MKKVMKKGFTLLELLIVIGILAILATTVVLVINPAQLLKKARDSQRISDLNSLKTAISYYITEISLLDTKTALAHETYFNISDTVKRQSTFNILTTLNRIYSPRTVLAFMLPVESSPIGSAYTDQTYASVEGAQCNENAAPSPPVSYTTDGNGWIPINFDDMTGGSPIGTLPHDPNPTAVDATPGRYYVYEVGSTSNYTFKLVANMESTYYSNGGDGDVESNDGGTEDTLYEVGTDMSIPITTGIKCYADTGTETSNNTWTCGDTVTFTYRGQIVTYGTVSHNGKCWMDRNLGASRVATSYDDYQSYGDLFQWGRCSDGHQDRYSDAYNGPVNTSECNNGNAWDGKFIYISRDSPYDWLNPQDDNLWQGVSGTNNPCPSGWRIPTYEEWDTERASWSSQDNSGAYASPLKLPTSGLRVYYTGEIAGEDGHSSYWSSTIDEDSRNIKGLSITSSDADKVSYERANGLSVRCIKD